MESTKESIKTREFYLFIMVLKSTDAIEAENISNSSL